MTSSTFVPIKARLTSSPNDANQHKNTITSHAGLVYEQVRQYVITPVIAKADKLIEYFKRGLLTPSDCS